MSSQSRPGKQGALLRKAEALLRRGEIGKARRLLAENESALSGLASYWLAVAQAAIAVRDEGAARDALHRALGMEGMDGRGLVRAGELLMQMGHNADASAVLRRALDQPGVEGEACLLLAELVRQQGGFDKADQWYERAAAANLRNAELYCRWASVQQIQGRIPEARSNYRRALNLDKSRGDALWGMVRLLPIIYESEDDVTANRCKFEERLNELDAQVRPRSRRQKEEALQGLLSGTNFYLQYQGRDDRLLQELYGCIAQRVMHASFPEWADEVPGSAFRQADRLRVGYVSSFLYAHNGAAWLSGWLRNRSASRFEVKCYHLGSKYDDVSRVLARHSDSFQVYSGDWRAACAQIRRDRLDILVYPELGMDAKAMAMAALRLAPVQCVGWGHPVTSGMRSMDYWLSSELMEPENGQIHYTEHLVRLPNLANWYTSEQRDRIASSRPAKSRRQFGFSDSETLYLCSQSLFKYLPRDDRLLVEIARRNPRARFVFVAISSVHVVRRFIARLDRAFSLAGLDAQKFCTMLPRQTPQEFVDLNRAVDVFLDNPSWSGNNTTLTAVDCGLPIVTLPTGLMRGRHTFGILKMLGLQDMIADSEESYVDMAVRLGLERDFRFEVKRRLMAARESLYHDSSVIRSLEAFYEGVVAR